jgi:hypothetical protein
MLHRLLACTEKVATAIQPSRRRFFRLLGQAASVAAAAAVGMAVARSLAASEPVPSPGACYYTSNGRLVCEQLTAAQCSIIAGSTWIPNASCGSCPAP